MSIVCSTQPVRPRPSFKYISIGYQQVVQLLPLLIGQIVLTVLHLSHNICFLLCSTCGVCSAACTFSAVLMGAIIHSSSLSATATLFPWCIVASIGCGLIIRMGMQLIVPLEGNRQPQPYPIYISYVHTQPLFPTHYRVELLPFPRYSLTRMLF